MAKKNELTNQQVLECRNMATELAQLARQIDDAIEKGNADGIEKPVSIAKSLMSTVSQLNRTALALIGLDEHLRVQARIEAMDKSGR